MPSYQTQMKVGLVVLILVVLGLGITIIDAIRQDIWGRAWLQIANLSLLSLAALIVIAAIWTQYSKQQPVGPMAFIILAMVTIMILWHCLKISSASRLKQRLNTLACSLGSTHNDEARPYDILGSDVEVLVPEGHYFVLGDYSEFSFDSRFEEIGFIEQDNVIGRVYLRIWPPERFGVP